MRLITRRVLGAAGAVAVALLASAAVSGTAQAQEPPTDPYQICNDYTHAGNSPGVGFPNGGDMDLDVKTCITSMGNGTFKSQIWVDWQDGDLDKPTHPFDGFKIVVRLENHDDPLTTKTCDVTAAINAGTGKSGYVFCDIGAYDAPDWSYYLSVDGYIQWDIDNDGLGYKAANQLTGSPVFNDDHGQRRHDIAAKAKSQQNVAETGDNCNPYSEALGYSRCGRPWCADFANWVYKQVGGVDRGGINGLADSFRTYGGPWHPKGDGFAPLPGDAILYDWDHNGEADHIGIVYSNINGQIVTYEGNSGDKVSQHTYSSVGAIGDLMGFTGVDWS
ncbi:CHAP domain-containing protein [Catellatospora sp. KI3]|uniref:CHAP domain-containing protein n=1 Tax=Catellatospora sp. KI3 TaxID=3041620 RepID=UPI0024823438|nr:CHAP domain-containing protein [Catellatospora sp. KI3]MDI1460608.1 CHAP domain-containing protein [Catellatospora sp. KI3]